MSNPADDNTWMIRAMLVLGCIQLVLAIIFLASEALRLIVQGKFVALTIHCVILLGVGVVTFLVGKDRAAARSDT